MSEGRDPEKFLKRFKNQHLKLVHFFPESEINPNTYLRCRIKKITPKNKLNRIGKV